MKSVQGGVTTYYISDLIEYSGGTFTKYYYADGQRIAQRVGSSAPTYTLVDHLGSTRYTLNNSGTKTSEMRYYPWGSTHYSSNPTATPRRQYTGQINDGDTGLYYYNARYYEPGLARFVQADTIVPNLNIPQTLNRYAYVSNNPIKYTDPTGHEAVAGENEGCFTDWCWQRRWYRAHGYEWLEGSWVFTGNAQFSDMEIIKEVLNGANIRFIGNWTFAQAKEAAHGVWDLASKMAGGFASLGLNPYDWLEGFLGGDVYLHSPGHIPYHDCFGGPACAFPWDRNEIFFPDQFDRQILVHELAHIIDWNSVVRCTGCIPSIYSWNFPFADKPISSYDAADFYEWENFADGVGIWVYGTDYYLFQSPLSDAQEQYLNQNLAPRGDGSAPDA